MCCDSELQSTVTSRRTQGFFASSVLGEERRISLCHCVRSSMMSPSCPHSYPFSLVIRIAGFNELCQIRSSRQNRSTALLKSSVHKRLTGQVTLQIANEPVLPFNALDIALEVQNSLKGDEADIPQLLAVASRLRDTAELFQSDEMRPANDPKERAPIRVRMLNDVLQSLEKSFLIHRAPPGLYRNILYRLDERTSQFSVLLEALEHCKLHQSNETIQAALSEVLNSINSAQVYFKAGLDVFETTLAGKK
ncbi:hypothetical protein AAES_114557 [Amazona aestiva]|uniref:Transferrin receptor-like dimerisation domain-containing protein n=1 Tax=Amazona aestiva TaxID=12930 RepID=A0A0Q3PCL8_AMAAE|nr:hypothetical protein AAES_114557 [Amazona aestiva]